MEEKEISTEDVKKQFEELSNKPDVEGSEETSTEETETAEETSEVEKTETAEVEDESKPIPYTRFKEVNDRKKELEELAESAKEFIVKDPVTGRLTLKMPNKEETKVEQEPEDKGLELNEEEQLAIDSVQMNVIKKVLNHELQQRQKQDSVQQVYREQTDNWWKKTTDDFPELKSEKFKDTPLYQRAVKILSEQHVVWSPDKKTFYIPPNAQYLSAVQAEKELAREKAKTKTAIIEEKKTQKSNIFVEKKSSKAPEKKTTEKKEFEEMSSSAQEDALRAQFEEANSSE